MNWAQVLLAVFQTLGATIGGPTGALIGQIVATGTAVVDDIADFQANVLPWINWANSIADAKRDPTPEEHAAARALADIVHANNQPGATPVALPSPPSS